ncbi:MAG: hypothetical protein EOO54_17860 [Haliea sp.]|nr:MAG: hypothetical protein EOO54_17860 [Haliea sp.]
MRAITGLIGKRNTANYRVTTTTATIGIRGSGFTAAYNPDGSLSVTTELDAIEVCNAGGCVGLTAGESALVMNNTRAPSRVGVRAPIPTPGLRQDPQAAGNQVNRDGTPRYLPASVAPSSGLTVAYTHSYPESYSINPTQVGPDEQTETIFSGNQLTQFSFNQNLESRGIAGRAIDSGRTTYTDTDTDTAASETGHVGQYGSADFVGWGTWKEGERSFSTFDEVSNVNYLSYVVGKPTALNEMPSGYFQSDAEYALAGGTAYSSTLGKGTLLNTSSLRANFSEGSAYAQLNTSFDDNGSNVDVNLYSDIRIEGNQIRYDCGDYVSGFFVGANATRAALTYRSWYDDSVAGSVSGAAVFDRSNELVPQNMYLSGNFNYEGDAVGTPSTRVNAFIGNMVDARYRGLRFFNDGTANYEGYPEESGSVGYISSGDFIGWGRWASGSRGTENGYTDIANLHYVVGQPTAVMPTSGTAVYSVIGNTTPTSGVYGSGSYFEGTLDSASLSANFGTSKVTASVTTSFNPNTPLTDTMTITGSTFKNSTSMQGFFSGTNASHAGLSYTGPLETGAGFGTGTFAGAVVFGPQQQQTARP